MTENNTFISFNNNQVGLIFDESDHQVYPIKYYNVINGIGLEINKDCSYYGYCYDGNGVIVQEGKTLFYIKSGMYFSSSNLKEIYSKENCKIVVIEVHHNKGIYPSTKYKAMDLLGGPIEKEGRLKYIDGCTDSLLIPPVKLGDPCFNHLHFPSDINQTQHTHPSHRIGIVAKGNGECITPFGNLPLTEGMIFVIKEWDGKEYNKGLDGKMYPNGTHSFKTPKENGMDVIAFHPDSDFGATDINHPMINRTIVDGVSANSLKDIRTK
tara:strand:- start:2365 stop:3165 length:801 start_codon:yes stop_codon:yes gene_type:complete